MPELDGNQNGQAAARRHIALAWILSLSCAVASVVISALVGGKAYVVASFIVVLCTIVPFFAIFEARRPQARALVMLAVMCALAVAARAAFIWLPGFL